MHFSEKWDFEHFMASPENQQANGKVEPTVTNASCRKNKDTHTDEFLALLDFRNTPTQRMGSSLSQILLNRRTCTFLRKSRKLMKPKLWLSEKTLLKHKQKIQAEYYNLHAHNLLALSKGAVRMRLYTCVGERMRIRMKLQAPN